MEIVEAGYKMTEIGMIPEDWDLIPFDTIFSFHSTSNYSKAEMSDEGDVGCIHYGLIHAIPNSQYNLEDGIKYYVSSEQAKYEYVRDGDVIMVDASEDLEGINKSVEVFGVGNKKFISGLHTYLLRDKNNSLAKNFRGIILSSQVVKNQMLQLAVGMKVFGVSKTQLIKVKIPLPPTLTEQKAIATALSDVDALISSLDKLIEKKKTIKQGAMQELLTPPDQGGKRLEGYSGEWIQVTFGDFGNCIRGVSYNGQDDLFEVENEQSIRLLRSNNVQRSKIMWEDIQFVNSARVSDTQKMKVGDILICMANGSRDLVGKSALYTGSSEEYTFGAFMGVFRSTDFQYTWLIHYFHSEFYRSQIDVALSGSSINNLRPSDIKKIHIRIPPTEKERKAIASILKDMDIEIYQLEVKRDKYKLVKKGMMQELLTGKIRLK